MESESGRGPQSFHHVICDATNPKDRHIFSDFMGFCMVLREHGVGGTSGHVFHCKSTFNGYIMNIPLPSISSHLARWDQIKKSLSTLIHVTRF